MLSAAQETIEKITVVISLLKPSFRKPTVDAVFRERADGGQDVFVHLTSNLEMRSNVGIVAAGKPVEIPTPTPAQQMLTHGTQNGHLERALHLWANPNRSWTHLYAILEEIEKHLGARVNKRGLCSAAKRDRFTRTANNAEAAGHDARHGSGNFQAPANPMPLTDAAAFIGELLRSQLQKTK